MTWQKLDHVLQRQHIRFYMCRVNASAKVGLLELITTHCQLSIRHTKEVAKDEAKG